MPSVRLPVREADRFGRGHAGIARADDLGPAADDRALDEAERRKAARADIGQQLGNRARAAAARRLGLGASAWARAVPRLLIRASPCHSDARARQASHRRRSPSPLLAWYDAHARDLPWRAPPGATRPTPIACGCPRSCCSRPRSPRCARASQRSSRAGPTVAALAAADDADADGRLGGAWLLCPRAQPDRLRPRGGRRAWRRFPGDRGGPARAARHRRLYRRGDRGDRVRASARWWSTPMSSGWSRGCSRSREPLPARDAGDPRRWPTRSRPTPAPAISRRR